MIAFIMLNFHEKWKSFWARESWKFSLSCVNNWLKVEQNLIEYKLQDNSKIKNYTRSFEESFQTTTFVCYASVKFPRVCCESKTLNSMKFWVVNECVKKILGTCVARWLSSSEPCLFWIFHHEFMTKIVFLPRE